MWQIKSDLAQTAKKGEEGAAMWDMQSLSKISFAELLTSQI